MQIIEFANAHLGGISFELLPWEYREQMRPWFQPLTFFVVSKVLLPVLDNPFWVLSIYRFLLGLLGFIGIRMFVRVLRKETPQAPEWIYKAPYLMFFVPWMFTRHSSESLSASLLLIASSLFILHTSKKVIFLAGLIMGAAFLARYQVAFFILGFVVAYLFLTDRKKTDVFLAFISFLVVVGLGVLIDRWGYQNWVFAPWNYFYQNVVLSKSAQWGVSPFWYYLYLMQQHVMPLVSMPMTIGFAVGSLRTWKHPISLGCLFFFVGHSLVGHKEMRFMFPILLFLPFFFAKVLAIQASTQRENQIVKWLLKPSIFRKIVILNSIALVLVCFWPSRPETLLQKVLWSRQDEIKLLYVRDTHPYVLADHAIEYVRPANLEILTTIPNVRGHWIVSKQGSQTVKEENAVCEIQWRIFPEWVEKFEFNNWLARTGNWVLAKCY